jgi:hypothetical protein
MNIVNRNNNSNKKKNTKKMLKPKVVVKTVSVPAKPAVSPLVMKFSKSLCDPFSPQSLGCRVPDSYAFPTSTYHLHGNETLTTGSEGKFGVLMLPTPNFSMIDTKIDAGVGSSIGGGGMTTFGGTGSLCYQACTTAALSAQFSTQRVVSWGIKISNLMPELSATGKLFIALVPTSKTIPSEALLQSTSINLGTICKIVTGMPTNALFTSAIEALPTSMAVTATDLLRGDIGISGSYTSPAFFNLKNTNQVAGVNLANFGDEFFTSTSGSVTAVATGFTDVNTMLGGVGIVIYGEGFPANTNCLQVEYIYHLEGSVGFATSAQTLVPSGNPLMPIGTQQIVEMGMSAVAGLRSVGWIAKGMTFLDNAVKTAKRAVNSPLGKIAIGLMS